MLDEPYEPTTIDAFAQELWEREGVYRFDPQAPGEVLSVEDDARAHDAHDLPAHHLPRHP